MLPLSVLPVLTRVLHADVPGPLFSLLDTGRTGWVTETAFVQYWSQHLRGFEPCTRLFHILRDLGDVTAGKSSAPKLVSPTDQVQQASVIDEGKRLSAAITSTAAVTRSTSGAGLPRHRRYLSRPDLEPLITDVVTRHPGLAFLEATPDFQVSAFAVVCGIRVLNRCRVSLCLL